MKWDSAGETSNSSQSERSVGLTSLKGGGTDTLKSLPSLLLYYFTLQVFKGLFCFLAAATENLLEINDYSSAVENVDNSTEPNNNSTTLWVRSCPLMCFSLKWVPQGGFHMSDCWPLSLLVVLNFNYHFALLFRRWMMVWKRHFQGMRPPELFLSPLSSFCLIWISVLSLFSEG